MQNDVTSLYWFLTCLPLLHAWGLSWYQVALFMYIWMYFFISIYLYMYVYRYICTHTHIISLCQDCISAPQHRAVSPCPLCKGKLLYVVHLCVPQASWKWCVSAPFWWYPSFFPMAGAPLTLPFLSSHIFSPFLSYSFRETINFQIWWHHSVFLMYCTERGRLNKMRRQKPCMHTVIPGTRHYYKKIDMHVPCLEKKSLSVPHS